MLLLVLISPEEMTCARWKFLFCGGCGLSPKIPVGRVLKKKKHTMHDAYFCILKCYKRRKTGSIWMVHP